MLKIFYLYKSWLAMLAFLFLTSFQCKAQEMQEPQKYRIGAGDEVSVTVPERPDLSKEVTVNKNGDIILPLVGNIPVAGLTTKEMGMKILQAMKQFYPSLTKVEVRLIKKAGKAIYILGQVGKPGKYVFPSKPNLWEVIREAGGPGLNASLDNVRIVKDKSKGGRSVVVNVMRALEMDSIENLPLLEGGDTIVIPEKTGVYTGSFGVNVVGAVQEPGIYRLQAKQDLMSAILLAGGPTRAAALDRIRIIRPQEEGNIRTVEVDLNKFLKEGDPLSNPALKPGDTIHIPTQNRLTFLFKNDLGFILNVVTTGVTIAAFIISVRYRR